MAQIYTSHQGKVVSCTADRVTVQITLNDACQHCGSQSGCIILNSKTRHIEVPVGKKDPLFEIGEEVTVKMTTNSGMKAVWYAYLLPTLLLVAGVGAAYALHAKDGTIALAALSVIGLYYLFLYFFRNRINRKFSFKVEKRVS